MSSSINQNFDIITSLKKFEPEISDYHKNVEQKQSAEWKVKEYNIKDWQFFWDEPDKLWKEDPEKFLDIAFYVKKLQGFDDLLKRHKKEQKETVENFFSDKSLLIAEVFWQKKKNEWQKDKDDLENSRQETKKKILEWENEEGKNRRKEQRDNQKEIDPLNFEIIEELKALTAFQEIKKEWHTKNYDKDKWEKFWKESVDKIGKYWEDNDVEFNKTLNKIRNLSSFKKLQEEWEKNHEGKNLDQYFPHLDWLVKETTETPRQAEKKRGGDWMIVMAAGGLIFLGAMLAGSFICATVCEAEEVILENGKAELQVVNIYLRILESQLMIVLVGTVIAPVVVRVLKEKYDIQIETDQVNMIIQDGISTVKMYNVEANKLRDKDGKIDDVSQRKLRNLAFSAMKQNYDLKKYNELISNVGVQVFEKAIEVAVESNKKDRLPIEREKIKEIISQAIDAVPHIVEWQKKDKESKELFLEGNVKKLLATVGIEGWASLQLENIFDAEISKRILAAAIANKNDLLRDLKDKNLLHLSTVVSATTESLAKFPKKE